MNPIIIVGLGGIGSHAAEPLARYLATLPNPPELVLVDGDSYTQGNRDRQRMGAGDYGANKATAQVRKLRAILPNLRLQSVEQFLSERNASEVIPEGALVLACPDSHAARLVVSRRCQRLRNCAAVFAGNDLTDGSVQVFVRRNGRELHPPIEQYHREIAQPIAANPADMSCEQLAARPGGGQVIFANFTAAAIALNAVYSLLEGRSPRCAETYFDASINQFRTRERK